MASSEAAKRAWETRRITHAISIRQPWAELIMRGIKVREFRSVPTNFRGRFYVYASQNPSRRDAYLEFGFKREKLPAGVLVGKVEVVDCEEIFKGTDSHRPLFAYVLANPRRLRQPVKPENHPQPIWFRPFDAEV
jgi:hypothetical protein